MMATSVPPPPPLPPTGSAGPTNLGLAPNVGALLCYAPCCLGLIFSIVVAVVEKQSRFVRFHAFQSLLIHGIAFAFFMAMAFLKVLLALIGLGPLVLILLPVQLIVAFGVIALEVVLMI